MIAEAAQPLARWHPPRHSAALCSVSMIFHSSKQQVDAMLKVYAARVYFKCFRCFRGMLQVLYIDVAKVYWEVADVIVMTIHVCQCFINRTNKFI
jgi:hypothetical protein